MGLVKRKELTMKKLILTLALVAMVLAASANSVRYFTRPQATRVAKALDAQAELMIYCGYEYELATYVIINEVWAEPVNSKYYEIWLYGYDAYTGEEIYMPIDLSCIWLYNSMSNRMYSAAQYLRFRSTVSVPNFYWTMPPYNPFIRYYHDPAFNRLYTYHYEIHRYGWRPPAHTHHGPAPYHPYYMRTPHTPATVPHKPFTPGVDHPSGNEGYSYINNSNRGGTTRSTSFNSRGGIRSGENNSNKGNPGVTSRTSTSSSDNGTRSSSTTTRESSTNNRGTTSTTQGSSRSSSTETRGSSSTNRGSSTETRGSSTSTRSTSTTNQSSTTTRGTSTNTRGSSTNTQNSSSSSSTRTSSSNTTRSSSTATQSNNSRNSSSSTRSSSSSTRSTESSSNDTKSSTRSSNRSGNTGRSGR